MIKNQSACQAYDLSSVRLVFTGAAPLGKETAEELQQCYPTWKVRQGYGKSISLCYFSEVTIFGENVFFIESGLEFPALFS
jgi:acyl-coenzyme A synthetase/AMP-(fatty) acid ligase